MHKTNFFTEKICKNMLENLAMRYKMGDVRQVLVENISNHGIIFISQIGSCRIGQRKHDSTTA